MQVSAASPRHVPLLRASTAKPWGRQPFVELHAGRQRRGGIHCKIQQGEETCDRRLDDGQRRQTIKIYLNGDEAREIPNMINAVRAALRSMGEVPTAYPLNIYSQLCMVDTLEKTGVSHYFASEIKRILDMAYKSWRQKDEEMIMEMETCAMAFRILRMHGYDVSSDMLSHFAEEYIFHDSVQGHLNDTKTLLELHKASQARILEDERTLENIGYWTGKLLRQQLCSNGVSTSVMPQEVEHALKCPFYTSTIEPLQHKRNIEHFITNGIQMRKSAFLACHAFEQILVLAVAEFHFAQSLYQQELQYIDSWLKEFGLDQLKFTRIMPLDAFFFLASAVFPCALSDARIAWIQKCLLLTAVDDFFDVAGSSEELKNLIALFEKWDAHDEIGFCSKNVETLFYAVYITSNKIGARAAEVQNRRVIGHIAQLWLDTARAMMTEAEWNREMHVLTMEEYMPIAELSALGSVVPTALYLVGPELSEDVIGGPEYNELVRLTNKCCRLLNDMESYRRESSDGKITNTVLLRALSYGEAISPASVGAATEDVKRMIGDSRRELLRLVTREGGEVPRPCKDVFWNMGNAAHLAYLHSDNGCTFEDMMGAVNSVVHRPLAVGLARDV